MKQNEKNEKYENCLKCKEMFFNRWENFMDYKSLAQKYIKDGIEWLEDTFGTYKGKTTTMETEGNLNGEQLQLLCDEIQKDTRVEMSIIDSEHKHTITIMFANKEIFEKEIFNIIEYKVYMPLKNCLDALLFDSSTNIAHMTCEVKNYIIDIDLTVCGEVNVEYKGVDYKSPSEFPKGLKKIIKNHYTGVQNMIGFCYVKDNNWFEFLYEVKNKSDKKHCYSGGILFEDNLYKYNQEELKEEFLNACLNAIGYYVSN